MKYNKPKFKHALWALFMPSKIDKLLQKVVHEEGVRLQEVFDRKMELFSFQSKHSGVSKQRFENEIMTMHLRDYGHQAILLTNELYKTDITFSPFCFSSRNIIVESIKQEASIRLANKLIDEGLLQVEVSGNTVRFSINIYK